MLAIEGVRRHINNLSAKSKNLLLAVWMDKQRVEASPLTLSVLFDLDDEWERVYQEYRIKKGFAEARILANEAILKIFYNE